MGTWVPKKGDRVTWRNQPGVISDDYWAYRDRFTVQFDDGSESDFGAEALRPARLVQQAEGMKPWPADGEAPDDWDRTAPIEDANGDIVTPRHTSRGMWHTIARYTPARASVSGDQ